jgi:hypothetical protein
MPRSPVCNGCLPSSRVKEAGQNLCVSPCTPALPLPINEPGDRLPQNKFPTRAPSPIVRPRANGPQQALCAATFRHAFAGGALLMAGAAGWISGLADLRRRSRGPIPGHRSRRCRMPRHTKCQAAPSAGARVRTCCVVGLFRVRRRFVAGKVCHEPNPEGLEGFKPVGLLTQRLLSASREGVSARGRALDIGNLRADVSQVGVAARERLGNSSARARFRWCPATV